MADKLTKTVTGATPAAPSGLLVNALLKRLDRIPADDSTAEQWEQLKREQPNVSFFIMACAHRAAPNDPKTRAMIARNMLNLYTLLGEAQLHDEISRHLDF